MTLGLLAVVTVAGLWVSGSVFAGGDPREQGEITKVETLPDGSTDIYRAQSDDEVVIEHRQVDGEVWYESNEVVGYDGKVVTCPDGQTLKIDPSLEEKHQPSPTEVARAQRGLPDGKIAVYNPYTGEFQTVDGQTSQERYGDVTAMEPMVYRCGANNEPVLVPLSKVDPEAAKQHHRQIEELLQGSEEVTGLGEDPASAAVAPPNR